MKMIWGRMKENPFLEKGILTNSGKFDSMDSEIAKKKLSNFLVQKKNNLQTPRLVFLGRDIGESQYRFCEMEIKLFP